jgi:hypothetical protein
VLEYRRQNQSTWTSVTPVSKTLGTYVSGGIVADGSLAGAYEVDFPDAAFASAAGVEWVALRIRGVTNMLPVLIEIELDAVDYQDAAGFGLSRIDQTIGSRATQTSVDAIIAAFPSNFGSMVINAGNGQVAAVLHDAEPNSIPEDAFQSGALSARVLADGAIDAGSIAAGALNGKGDWLTTLGTNAPANWINAASIAASALNGKGDWLTTLGATAPAGWINDPAIASDAVTKITVNLFKYGDVQRWTSPANQINVTITKVS